MVANITIQVPNDVNACLFTITDQEAQGDNGCVANDPAYE